MALAKKEFYIDAENLLKLGEGKIQLIREALKELSENCEALKEKEKIGVEEIEEIDEIDKFIGKKIGKRLTFVMPLAFAIFLLKIEKDEKAKELVDWLERNFPENEFECLWRTLKILVKFYQQRYLDVKAEFFIKVSEEGVLDGLLIKAKVTHLDKKIDFPMMDLVVFSQIVEELSSVLEKARKIAEDDDIGKFTHR